MIRPPPISTRTDTPFPYTTLFRSREGRLRLCASGALHRDQLFGDLQRLLVAGGLDAVLAVHDQGWGAAQAAGNGEVARALHHRIHFRDRKSTRLNSSH